MLSRDAAPRANTAPRAPAIDGLRVLGIAGVVLLHLFGIAGVLAATAGEPLGVAIWAVFGNVIDMFFIVSGFGLMLGVVARGSLGSLRTYAIGRAGRLLPAYWLALVVALLLIVATPPDQVAASFHIGAPSVSNLLSHLIAMQMPSRLVDGGFVVGFGLNGALWMISVIVGFYLVFPLFADAYARHPAIGLAAGLVITVLWKEAIVWFAPQLADLGGHGSAEIAELIAVDQLPGWAFSFALGMTGACAYARYRDRDFSAEMRQAWIAITTVALVVYAYCAWRYGVQASNYAPFGGAAGGTHARLNPWLGVASSASRAVLMATIIMAPAYVQRSFANRVTSRLAELSYSVYLIHLPIAIYVGVILLDLPTNGSLAACASFCALVLPLSLLYAYGSVRLVERPARRWVRAVTSRPVPTAPPARAKAVSNPSR